MVDGCLDLEDMESRLGLTHRITDTRALIAEIRYLRRERPIRTDPKAKARKVMAGYGGA